MERYLHADQNRLLRRSGRRTVIGLKGREYPLGQFLIWVVYQIGFVLAVALPYWGVYETTTSSFRDFGLGKLSIHHGVWQVCVSGVGSGCFEWKKLREIDPEEHAGGELHTGIQVAAGLSLAFSPLAGISTIVWLVNNVHSIPRTAIISSGVFNLLAGTSATATVIVSGFAYREHVLGGWCLFVSIIAAAGFIGLSVSAWHYSWRTPPISYIGNSTSSSRTSLPHKQRVPRRAPPHHDLNYGPPLWDWQNQPWMSEQSKALHQSYHPSMTRMPHNYPTNRPSRLYR